ncbi:MAG: HIT domain-containing protein [Candidatus Nanopelagicales bacterium]|jgi:diadenosine tetraphosphate (Ap4A) HIT family hydrolase/5-methylcytosine-specific restriction endonuclease McrA
MAEQGQPRIISPFLDIPPEYHVAADDLTFAIRDKYPVTPGHTLIIPRRVIPQWWDATTNEQQAILAMVDRVRADLLDDDTRSRLLPGVPRPDGFNVGFNAGEVAGQTVNHLHMHVIPRYCGDMDDPRGGVRHVIPEKGNYLAPTQLTVAPRSSATDFESMVIQQLEPAALMTWLLSIIQEGKRSATYKPALLMAILDAVIEAGDVVTEGTTLRISLDELADRVIRGYWPQTRPNPLGDDGVLRQGSSGLRIIEAVVDFRSRTGCTPHADIHSVIASHPSQYLHLQRAVKRALARQPIPRLQRPGAQAARAGYEPWLYDDSGFVAEKGAIAGVDGIELNRGVAFAMATNAQVLRPALESVWTAEVARYNGIGAQEKSLRDFLFGAQRTSLDLARDVLLDIEGAQCFYCERSLSLGAIHVDHVIPWSQYPLNDLANLVLSDDKCNGDKSAHLVSAERLAKWVARDQDELSSAAEEITWAYDGTRTLRIADSSYRWHPHGIPVWRGHGDLIPYDTAEQDRALQVLSARR